MFSKILVPIDGSEMAWHALAHARTLGEKFGSEITVMHVVQPYNTIPVSMDRHCSFPVISRRFRKPAEPC